MEYGAKNRMGNRLGLATEHKKKEEKKISIREVFPWVCSYVLSTYFLGIAFPGRLYCIGFVSSDINNLKAFSVHVEKWSPLNTWD